MRGRIIHYSDRDGRGLIAAGNRQFPFAIRQWHSGIAPAVNQVVELTLAGDALQSVALVPGHVRVRERARQLARTLADALGRSTPDAGGVPTPAVARGPGARLLAAYALFALSALLLPFVSVAAASGAGVRSFTLFGLAGASPATGVPVSAAYLPVLAMLSFALPLAWRSRAAWLALLLPLLATLEPLFDIFGATARATRAMGDGPGTDLGQQVAGPLAALPCIGAGAWACLLPALFIAFAGLKRAFPVHRP